jgi:hypothetical protein
MTVRRDFISIGILTLAAGLTLGWNFMLAGAALSLF